MQGEVIRGEALGRGSEEFFKFPAEMGFSGEIELSGRSFSGVTVLN
jgi:hypothetical protein